MSIKVSQEHGLPKLRLSVSSRILTTENSLLFGLWSLFFIAYSNGLIEILFNVFGKFSTLLPLDIVYRTWTLGLCIKLRSSPICSCSVCCLYFKLMNEKHILLHTKLVVYLINAYFPNNLIYQNINICWYFEMTHFTKTYQGFALHNNQFYRWKKQTSLSHKFLD